MYCNKCGKKLKENANFCNNCGSPVENKVDDKYDYNKTSSINDEDLIKAYVGNNYYSIKNTKFSIPTFFLGTYYFLYRKMWLQVLLVILISIASLVISIVTEMWYISFATSLYMIFISIKFSDIYLDTVRKRVEKIKMNNPDKTSKELLDICKSKGGVSVLAVVITVIFILPIVLFVTFFTILYGVFEGIDEGLFDNYKSDIKNESELDYDIPDIYKKNDNSYNSDTYQSYHYNDSKSSCSISITNYTTYSNKSIEEHLKDNVISSMNEDVSEIKNETINNYKWSSVEINSKEKKEYKYASVYNERLYIVSYVIKKDNNKLCSNGYNTFIKSLRFNLDKSGVDNNTV